ncbi:MAG: zinc-dependent peptidase [Betaproteobacteria bacterium]|nr:zinc-dependent peptidase [Betaproteobacteria bacterium]
MFGLLRKWRRERVLKGAAIPDALWHEACATLPFLDLYDAGEIDRLRALVVLFLDAKAIVGARGHEVTPLQRVIIAIQACVLILELDLAWYDDFENVIVYPDEFVPGWEYEDEAGVVHRQEGPLAGEAMPHGPVALSWPDVAASGDWDTAGMNLVIHEFAHKLDMRSGDANGCPPLPPGLSLRTWTTRLDAAYAHFHARVQLGRHTHIDPYAAESPAEFFAVLAEVFFADPLCFRREYRGLYELYVQFFRQDPAARVAARAGSERAPPARG